MLRFSFGPPTFLILMYIYAFTVPDLRNKDTKLNSLDKGNFLRFQCNNGNIKISIKRGYNFSFSIEQFCGETLHQRKDKLAFILIYSQCVMNYWKLVKPYFIKQVW